VKNDAVLGDEELEMVDEGYDDDFLN